MLPHCYYHYLFLLYYNLYLSDDEIKVIDEINKELIAVKDSFKLVKDRTPEEIAVSTPIYIGTFMDLGLA